MKKLKLTSLVHKTGTLLLAALMTGVLGACGAAGGASSVPAASSGTSSPDAGAASEAASVEASAAISNSDAPASFEPTPEGEKTELMVSAAASLTDALGEIKTLYEAAHPNLTITFNFGASGTLQQQIEQGAPADVFFSAGKKQMQALSEKGLTEDTTVRDILKNQVVLVTLKGGSKLASFEALAEDSVKQIGVGEPGSVPVGQYTAEIFDSLKLADTLAPKLVLAKDVREVLSWVETGNVDAGIVYETDARISDKVEISCAAPADSHKAVVYPVGVLKESKLPEEARAFVNFLFTDAAKEIFSRYGFTPLDELAETT